MRLMPLLSSSGCKSEMEITSNTKEGMPTTATINISCWVEDIKPWAFFREEPPHPIDSILLAAFDSSCPSDRSRAVEHSG
ncbi:hypothetical protein BHM03_00010227 [Ensete ventricosum]|uniref:Uncharacterized protein n=1 Tax=Ensete ventricosum TaxID=4639 RepID=A0A426ZRD9_ENSVE|nr:hypothetical protein B296_00007901 [Ensete ventricosum]RZR72069.1 hypothetical protein BHM03_00010227 [Ensete ventricosum]